MGLKEFRFDIFISEHFSYGQSFNVTRGFTGGMSGKEPACQHRRRKRRRFDSWVGKILWRRAWQPPPVFLPRESHGQRGLAGYGP